MAQQFNFSEGSAMISEEYSRPNDTLPPDSPVKQDMAPSFTKVSSEIIEIREIFGIPASPVDHLFDDLTRNLINAYIAIICILGLLGNGRTIYLLTYSVKRNSFTTYILSLSIADFGVLVSLIIA
ncbi:mas-related G-protein coupled receptor member X4-like, partial [Python bivittatus]|uniref:Mas-related G-protein coupled receptor member X4-like n=1 Tax=Python bivittatus TaxID=176946 RepID=A0A9F5MVH8_PYTBI